MIITIENRFDLSLQAMFGFWLVSVSRRRRLWKKLARYSRIIRSLLQSLSIPYKTIAPPKMWPWLRPMWRGKLRVYENCSDASSSVFMLLLWISWTTMSSWIIEKADREILNVLNYITLYITLRFYRYTQSNHANLDYFSCFTLKLKTLQETQ